jgi:hypothetical protein
MHIHAMGTGKPCAVIRDQDQCGEISAAKSRYGSIRRGASYAKVGLSRL